MAAPVLSTSFCTLDDLRPVIQAQNEINQLFQTIIEGGSAVDTFKVAVNGSDVSPDYLHAKLFLEGEPSGNAVVVRAQTVADSSERLFWEPSEINNYIDTGVIFLAVSGGALTWTEVDAVVDNFTVKVTATDSTSSFLHDAFNRNAAYVGDADILVATATVGADATNQKESLFVDVSTVSGYSDTGIFFLGLVNNVSTYINASSIVSGGLSVGYALDISGSTVSFDPTEITGFTSEFQFFMHLASASAATDPAWKTVSSYDATKNQIQWHQSGSFAFKTTDNYSTSASQSLSHINGSWQWLGVVPRFAITTEAIPASTGNYNGNITPGKTNGSSNIRLYDYGAAYGDPATQSSLALCENYMRSTVAIHKPIFVFERAPGIFVLPAEGCTAIPAT